MNAIDKKTPEPLATLRDLDEFREGLQDFKDARWFEDRWKTFRLRFGVYEQRQKGQHMVRAKIPGGRLSFLQARAAAATNRDHAGGDIHVTTRQDLQFYFLPLDNLPPFLEGLYKGGVTTREASGNTFRNATACPLAGFCPHEKVDAGAVAERLSINWLRHPLTQHMPRKFKIAVSGCAHDCGQVRIDDLGLIAITVNGIGGFQVVAGGGLGTHPRVAVDVFDFIREEDLPAVQEAFARVHHRYSDRANKNKSRIKFLVDRFGKEKFRALVHEELERVRSLPQRPWTPLTWRDEVASPEENIPLFEGTIKQTNGRYAIKVNIPLGIIDSERLIKLTDLAETNDAEDFVLARDQNIVARNLPAAGVQPFIDGVRKLNFNAGENSAPMDHLVACPGTSTCAIGITDSYALAKDLINTRNEFDGLPDSKIRISGCHNSCGHHHIAEIGLHGIAKKIDGKPAPHYQLHLGGSADEHGIPGPIIPARKAKDTIKHLLKTMHESRKEGESVRAWAERLGRKEISSIVSSAPAQDTTLNMNLHTDVASEDTFIPPETSTGECAAAAVVAEHLSDLAITARENTLRALAAGRVDDAIAYAHEAVIHPAQRLLVIAGIDGGDDAEQVLDNLRAEWGHDKGLVSALDAALGALADAPTKPDEAIAALVAWHAASNEAVEDILSALPGFLGTEAAE